MINWKGSGRNGPISGKVRKSAVSYSNQLDDVESSAEGDVYIRLQKDRQNLANSRPNTQVPDGDLVPTGNMNVTCSFIFVSNAT
jgi:hypothetical protein